MPSPSTTAPRSTSRPAQQASISSRGEWPRDYARRDRGRGGRRVPASHQRAREPSVSQSLATRLRTAATPAHVRQLSELLRAELGDAYAVLNGAGLHAPTQLKLRNAIVVAEG